MAKLVSDGVTLNGRLRLLLMSLPLLDLPLLVAARWLPSGPGADVGEFILSR